MSISEFHNRFTKVNVTLPFHNKVWKDFWYRFNKLRYRDWNALLTTPWPPYLKTYSLITIRMDLNGNENDYEEDISRRCRIIRGSIHGDSTSDYSESHTQITKSPPENLYQLRAAGYL